jgi:hypothetical protein
MGKGVENLDPGVFTKPENESKAAGLDPLVGVEATVLRRDGVCCVLPEFLLADTLKRGDLKGFKAAFPSIPEGGRV